MDDDDFLAAIEADNANAPVEDQEPAEPPKPDPAPEPEQPVPAEPAPPEPAPPPPEAPAAQPGPGPQPGYVPITAILDEREKRQAAETELARYRAWEAQQRQQAQTPDAYEDPEGFARVQREEFRRELLNQTLNNSERFARKEYGPETVDAAKQWITQRVQQDPIYYQQVMSDPDPYDRLVNDYRKDQMLREVSPTDFEQFKAWKQAQTTLQQAAPAVTPTTASAIPPPSLASAPSAGGILSDVVQSDEDIFAETFSKKE